MAEGNGEIIEEMATTHKTDGNGEPERTEDYPKLVEYGLDKRVNKNFIKFNLPDFCAKELIEINKSIFPLNIFFFQI